MNVEIGSGSNYSDLIEKCATRDDVRDICDVTASLLIDRMEFMRERVDAEFAALWNATWRPASWWRSP